MRAIRGDYKPVHATLRVPIISATAVQWTGASPWMDLVQRALTWEAREPGLYVNLFFGFPFADVPDVGMTIQVITNDNARLAAEAASDVAGFAWRQRKALLTSTRIHAISDGVALRHSSPRRAALSERRSEAVLSLRQSGIFGQRVVTSHVRPLRTSWPDSACSVQPNANGSLLVVALSPFAQAAGICGSGVRVQNRSVFESCRIHSFGWPGGAFQFSLRRLALF